LHGLHTFSLALHKVFGAFSLQVFSSSLLGFFTVSISGLNKGKAMNDTQRPMTFGEKACGVSFNPGGLPNVAMMKEQFAAVVDMLHTNREMESDPEVKRMLSIAITETQTAQMWAIKAITWKF
jgi:phosphoribosylpyrophosphate synthetase